MSVQEIIMVCITYRTFLPFRILFIIHQFIVASCLCVCSCVYVCVPSDELTEITMNTNDECGNSSIDAVVVVHTSADHFKRRERFRMAYSNYSNTKPYRLKVVFLIGSVLDANLQIQLERENMMYGDTVVGSFLDTYQNLTLKAVMGFRWLASTCPNVKLLIKLDDDVFIDVRKFFTNYWEKVASNNKKRTIHCLVWHNARVGRTGKWKVEKGLFANASYPFPYCAGFLTLVTPDLIEPMYTYGKSIDFFWIDDVFLYGMIPSVIQGVNFVQLGHNPRVMTQNYKEYKQCRESKGVDKCPLWATLTNGEDEIDQEFAIISAPKPVFDKTVTTKKQYSKDNKQTGLIITSNLSPVNTQQKNLPSINKVFVKIKQV
ncbi:unnamed protein product [Candidula unifasciata]|uniref:Hexosyltransferase n=1 Tax=Candidula unifasciata TaxID=100452 RepID=A0A8S3Z992_9EUPU|nr:unnamed protein product [Candidula unifasciata]